MKTELLNKKDEPETIVNKVSSTAPKQKNKKNGCLSTGMMTVIIIFVTFLILGKLVIEPSNEKYYNNQAVIENLVTSYDDFSNIIQQWGFSGYTLERDELLDDLDGEGTIGIRIKMSNANGTIYIKDGAIHSIRYADNYLYKDGIIQHTLSEYTVTYNEKKELILKTQNAINGILKSPSTAKYPLYDSWAVGKINGATIVQGYVDSQNSFGATIRSTFQVTYTNNIITSLIFDGEECIK